MIHKGLGIVVILGILSSCINMNDPKIQADYIRCYNSFDSTLVEFFPDRLPNSFIGYGFASLEFLDDRNDYAGIHITTKAAKSQNYIQERNKYKTQARAIHDSMDSSLLVINTYGQLHERTQGNMGCSTHIPVPQYALCEANDSTHLWERVEGLEIMVIDWGFKDILNRSSSKLRKDLPMEFSAGYSKGITFNSNNRTIQRWLIIW